MVVTPSKKRVNLSLNKETLEALELLTVEFGLTSKSDFISALIAIIGRLKCKIFLREILDKKTK